MSKRAAVTSQIMDIEGEVLSTSVGSHSPIVWDQAAGSKVWDVEGNEYIDLTCGICVTSLGHCHPRVTSAISRQLQDLVFCYEFPHPNRSRYAQRLLDTLPFDEGRVLFKSTGGEAIDTSMLFAQFETGRNEFIAYHGAFHGGTFGALALTGERKYKEGYFLGEKVHFVPYPYCYRCPLGQSFPGCDLRCADLVAHAIEYASTGSIAALVAEPMQSSAGVIIPPEGYWRRVQQILDEHDILLIFDEIQTGFARTGRFYGFEHYGVVPDIIVLSKAIANGLPMSVVVARSDLLAHWGPDAHSSTFGGNPLACAAGLAVLDTIASEDIVGRSQEIERIIQDHLRPLANLSSVGDIRGLGALWGVEFVLDRATREPAPPTVAEIRQDLREAGILTVNGGVHGNMIRVLPALTIDFDLLHQALTTFTSIVREHGEYRIGRDEGDIPDAEIRVPA